MSRGDNSEPLRQHPSGTAVVILGRSAETVGCLGGALCAEY